MLKTIARNAFWNGLGTTGGIVLGVITSAVIARNLGTTGTGNYKYVLWLIGLVVTLATLGLPNAVARFGAEFLGRDDLPGARALLQRVVLIELGLGTIMALGTAASAWLLAPVELRFPLLVGALIVVPTVLGNVFQSAAYGAQHYRSANRVSVLLSALQLLMIIAVLSCGWGIPGILAALLLRQTAYALYLARHAGRLYPDWHVRAVFDVADRRRVQAYVGDMTVILFISTVVWESSEVLFLRHYFAPDQVAFYGLAFEYAQRAMSIPAMLSGVFMPSISTMFGRGDQASIGQIFVVGSRLVALIALPLGLGGAAIAPAFVLLVLGPEFQPVAPLLAALLVGNIFGAVAAVNAAVVYGINNQRFIIKIGLVITVLNLALNVLLIPRWAATGAVMANSASQIVASVVGCWYVARRLGTDFPIAMLARTTLAAAGCAGVAFVVSASVPGLAGLLLAVPIAAVVYVWLLRLSHALLPEDVVVLGRIADLLPRSIGRPYRRILARLSH